MNIAQNREIFHKEFRQERKYVLIFALRAFNDKIWIRMSQIFSYNGPVFDCVPEAFYEFIFAMISKGEETVLRYDPCQEAGKNVLKCQSYVASFINDLITWIRRFSMNENVKGLFIL